MGLAKERPNRGGIRKGYEERLAMSRQGVQLLRVIASESKVEVKYEIFIDWATRELSCSCPAWIYGGKENGRRRVCKHIKKHWREEAARITGQI
jgi:hypothetical protein